MRSVGGDEYIIANDGNHPALTPGRPWFLHKQETVRVSNFCDISGSYMEGERPIAGMWAGDDLRSGFPELSRLWLWP
jgi:hypothetical protein